MVLSRTTALACLDTTRSVSLTWSDRRKLEIAATDEPVTSSDNDSSGIWSKCFDSSRGSAAALGSSAVFLRL